MLYALFIFMNSVKLGIKGKGTVLLFITVLCVRICIVLVCCTKSEQLNKNRAKCSPALTFTWTVTRWKGTKIVIFNRTDWAPEHDPTFQFVIVKDYMVRRVTDGGLSWTCCSWEDDVKQWLSEVTSFILLQCFHNIWIQYCWNYISLSQIYFVDWRNEFGKKKTTQDRTEIDSHLIPNI